MKNLTIQIKPAGNYCNIDCTYCYASPFRGKTFKKLPIELVEKIIKEAFETTDNLIITWHGGEPTIPGVEYYKEVMALIKKYKKRKQNVVNMIQTNATLITDEFANFFKKNKFVVSVSLDGSEMTHNKNRIYGNGKGSYADTMRGVEILRKNGIYPPVIATVSKSTYKDCEETFNFLIKNGFKEIKYSPVYDSKEDSFSISPDEWYEYIHKVFEMWMELGKTNIKIREIDIILAMFLDRPLNLCTSDGSCVNWISIDENGNMYPCEYMRETNTYGNIAEMNVKDIFSTEQYQDFKKQVLTIPQSCKECSLISACGNGCPATRINNYGDLTRTGKYVYCSVRKRMYEDIKCILSL